ncbi:MAG TPA: LpxL/LpxP family Kdo(2)-lipid IV(A) lauroyl/palmitoleoyl acyltransferase [Rudaea sp.]|nr:LpxL/LpxP family Kdo(2)-lipid IV(A) lauroyl/palmitoleoyl acyltransferase [Rudaea sp.]
MTEANDSSMPAALLAPRYWFSWLGVGILRLVACLPFGALRGLGHALGMLTAHLPGSRRRVAQRNLQLCFPELSVAQRAQLLQACLADLGMMLVEFALAWMGSNRAIARVPCVIEGLEHLQACRDRGQGVLLVGAHFSHLELCARLVSQRIRIAGMYRIMDNAVFERVVLRARLGYADAMFTKQQLRASVKYLKNGGTLWYAPDQDMRGKESVFVPFFGVPASTITATHHLTRLSGAVVIPFFHARNASGDGYEIRLQPPLENFPTHDVNVDTSRVNAAIEAMVRAAPTQYLWVHKRFKTRPPDAVEQDIYAAGS